MSSPFRAYVDALRHFPFSLPIPSITAGKIFTAILSCTTSKRPCTCPWQKPCAASTPTDNTTTSPTIMSAPGCSSVLWSKFASDLWKNSRLTSRTITAKSCNPSKQKGPAKTRNDDGESCAVPNGISMKKTIAALFNPRCFNLSGACPAT